MNIRDHNLMHKDINRINQFARTRIEWSKMHDGKIYDESLLFWIRCLYRRAIDRYHPELGPELRGYCRITH